MKKLMAMFTFMFMAMSVQSASSLTLVDHVNADLQPDKLSAELASKKIIEEMGQKGRLYRNVVSRSCPIAVFDGKASYKGVRIVPVANEKSNWKKMYQAEVEYRVECQDLSVF